MDTKPDYKKVTIQKDFDDKMKNYREKWEKEIIKKQKEIKRKEEEKESLKDAVILALCLIPLVVLIVYAGSIVIKAIIFIPTIIIAIMASASKAGKGK